ncbi:MAG: hypothetical protein NTZ55_04420 [Candidatus Roizmanbacteria bacterium]|nr:hypothetical protein [Candidatus Roizmanbacteria bacterium]
MKTKRNESIIGIVGLGQVGSAIWKLTNKFYKVLTKDLLEDFIKEKRLDILHVCIPYSNKFEDYIVDQINLNHPKLVIINSTTKPGTTRNIFLRTHVNTVHSPVMGVHPRLYYYLFQFPKFIGPVNRKSGLMASSHFKFMGIKTTLFNNPEETEMAKLLDTTYYGLNIVFSKWAKEICDTNKLEFNNVYSKFNLAYNEGYSRTLPQVRRPILKPVKGPIGGTCVVPNAIILNEFIPNGICKLIKNAE